MRQSEDIQLDEEEVYPRIIINDHGYFFGIEHPNISFDDMEIEPTYWKFPLYDPKEISVEDYLKKRIISEKLAKVFNMRIGKHMSKVSLEKNIVYKKDIEDAIKALNIFDIAANSGEIDAIKKQHCQKIRQGIDVYIENML